MTGGIIQLLTLLNIHQPPHEAGLFTFTGLLYPFVLVINILLMLIWMAFGKKIFLFPLAVILVTINISAGYIQLNPFKKTKTENSIKVLTYNVKYLGKDDALGLDKEKENIFNFLEHQKPDIICLQEFDCQKGAFQAIVDELKERTNIDHYIFTRYYPGSSNTERILLLVKQEVTNKGSLADIHKRRFAVYADIIVNEDTVRVINCHLQSVYLREEDNLGLNDFTYESQSSGVIQEKSKKIYNKLARAFEKRALQTAQLKMFIQQSPYEVILCGDFNDTPSSYAYSSIKEVMTDAFCKSGRGVGTTYHGKYPSFRIDYIFHSKKIRSAEYHIYNTIDCSDHYPVSVMLDVQYK